MTDLDDKGYQLGIDLANEGAEIDNMAELLEAFQRDDVVSALTIIREFIPVFSKQDLHLGNATWEKAIGEGWSGEGRDM